MIKLSLVALLSFVLPFSSSPLSLLTGSSQPSTKADTGNIEKMIVTDGSVSMDLDLNSLRADNARTTKNPGMSELRFSVDRDSFFTVMAFDGELRGAMPGTIPIVPQNSPVLPDKLNASRERLVVEKMPAGEHYELVIRDGKTGFVFFNVEGHLYNYDANSHLLKIQLGRMLVSSQFAAELGRPSDVGKIVGGISLSVNLRAVEITQIVDGNVESSSLPPTKDPSRAGTTPGPDVVVGDLFSLSHFGTSGSKVGLAVGTTSCNFGTEDLNWARLPSNDHPVIPQNMYRMSGGADNQERFEQIGQSSVKHAFLALTQNLCNLGCNGVGGSRLGSGCSDPYSAGLNAGPNLGSRAWINPFDGFYPRGDSATSPNDHSAHSHDGTTHRILTESSDLLPTSNPGASYFAEAQYITPHEYQWCQTNPDECNMYNNVSYRKYNVSGTSTFSFQPDGSTVREKAAIEAWEGATFVVIEPEPGVDGTGVIAYKVTNTGPGVWHYEYAVYNQNLDRAIGSFEIPLSDGITISNVGFHAPPQHPGTVADGTLGGSGFSEAAWTPTETPTAINWSTESLAQNQNANAIRWGTTYNFRFDSSSPPVSTNATVGFFKTGAPITAAVMGPAGSPVAAVSMSGRVTTANGQGVVFAYVQMSDVGGIVYAGTTNAFGYYRIDGITPGETYDVGVFSKSYSFGTQLVTPNANVSGIDFVEIVN